MQVTRCSEKSEDQNHSYSSSGNHECWMSYIFDLLRDNSGDHGSSSRDNECQENQARFGPMWWKHWLHHNTKGDWKMYFKAAALPPRRRCILPRHQRKCGPGSPFRYNHRYTVQMLGCSSSLSLNNGCFFMVVWIQLLSLQALLPLLCHLAAAEFKINLPQTVK